jgi:hypothetical protein
LSQENPVLRSFSRTTRNERGATLVFTALTIPVIVFFGAVSIGLTSLWTAHHDVQRGVDLGSLAGAASTPTFAPTEIPVTGLDQTLPLDFALDKGEWLERPCAVFKEQLVGDRSKVATAFSDGEAPICEQHWAPESPLLAVLSFCAEHLLDQTRSCRDQLEQELRATLPVVNSLDASAMSAVEEVWSDLSPANKLVGRALADQLGNACAKELGTTVLGITEWQCLARVRDVLKLVKHDTGELVGTVDGLLASIVAALQASAVGGYLDPLLPQGIGIDPNAVPQLKTIDPDTIAPALLTPRLTVSIKDLDLRPPFSPFTFDMAATATARRQIKSVLVLPSAGIPGVEAFSSLSVGAQAQLGDLLGVNAAAAVELAYQRGAQVIDPNIYNFPIKKKADRVLNALDRTESKHSVAIGDALCPALAGVGVSCPVGDDVVNRQHLFGPFMEDVRDATQPPPSDTHTPTIQDLLQSYADSEQPVWVVSALKMFLPERVFGGELWQTLTNPQGAYSTLIDPPTNVSSLVSPLMFIPAMDVVPASIFRDGDVFYIKRISNVAATTGLYKARLVK